MNEILTVNELTKKFGSKKALDRLTFSIQSSRIVGLMGPNGAGKTTLFKTILGIHHADSGEVFISGEKASASANRLIAYMPDINFLPDWMHVQDAAAYTQDMFTDFDSNKAGELAKLLQLDVREKVRTLSTGTRQRVLVMLTFARQASLYLLDEPIGGIDPLDKNKLIKTILSGFNENSSIIISTHLVKDIETMVDEVLFLNRGHLVLHETAENIRLQRGQSIEECYMEVLSDDQAF